MNVLLLILKTFAHRLGESGFDHGPPCWSAARSCSSEGTALRDFRSRRSSLAFFSLAFTNSRNSSAYPRNWDARSVLCPQKSRGGSGRDKACKNISTSASQVIGRAEPLHDLIPGPRKQLVFGTALAWPAVIIQFIGRDCGVHQQVRRRGQAGTIPNVPSGQQATLGTSQRIATVLTADCPTLGRSRRAG